MFLLFEFLFHDQNNQRYIIKKTEALGLVQFKWPLGQI